MIRIITDSVSAIPPDTARAMNIDLVTLYVNREGEEYADVDIDKDTFYADIYDMIDDIPTTSQPSQHHLEELFEHYAQQGDSVLGIFISTEFSGTFDGAVRAARVVKSRNLGFTCKLIDSTSNSYDEAWPVYEAVEARDAGLDLEGCAKAALRGIACSRIMFIPDSLTFLKMGGRIGGAAALLGNIISIVPIITVRDGKALPLAKVRTHAKAMDRMFRQFKEDVERHGLKRVMVHYIGDKSSALRWAREVIEPFVGHGVEVLPCSPVIGLHVGPAIGIAYECMQEIVGKLTAKAGARAFAL